MFPRSLGSLPLLVAGALCLASPAEVGAQEVPLPGLILTSDSSSGLIRLQNPVTNKVVFDFPTSGRNAAMGGCDRGICFPLGARYVNHGGDDFIDVAIVRYGVLNPDPQLWWPSVVTRIKVANPPQEVFTIKELDFRDVPGGDHYCVQSVDEPFAPQTRSGCILSFVHGIDIVEDVPEEQRVTMLISDPWNQRVLQATLDYAGGNTAAHVDWVLGSHNPDWPAAAWPNHVMQMYGDDGERYMLTTFVDAENTPYSAAPLIMWRYDPLGGEWFEVWRHPDPLSGSLPFLQGSHMGEILRDPLTGDVQVWYGHGRGLASGWNNNSNSDLGGSFGLLQPGETLSDPPSYIFDVELFSDDDTRGVNYGRDVDYLPDGTFLMVDGACQSGGCPQPGGVYRVARFSEPFTPSDRSGAFSGDRSTQTVQEVPASQVLESYHCGYLWLFEAEFIPASRLGRNLKNLDRRATTLCPDF